MAIIDITIILFITFWTIIGLSKGFVSELISLFRWFFALYFSINYNHIPTEYISNFIGSPEISNILSFVLIFFIAFLVSIFLGFFLSQLVKILGFAYSNRILGLFAGFIKGNIFILIIVYILSLTEFESSIYWNESQFIPFFDDFIDKFIKSHDTFFDSFNLKI